MILVCVMGRGFKKVKRRIPWISHIVGEENASEFRPSTHYLTRVDRSKICILCRGARNLCGRRVCPVILKSKRLRKTVGVVDKEVDGSSPPEIFVGRIGYPKVFAGPILHPEKGDIEIFGTPELWSFSSIDEFLDMRLSLIRGMRSIDVRNPQRSGSFYDKIVDTVLSKKSVDTYAEFLRIHRSIIVDPYVQPIGVGGSIKTLEVEARGTVHPLEKVLSDEDLNALEAMKYLYRRGVLISKIIQGLSAGMLGVKYQRKLVPTRWSITAVDCIISKWLRDDIIKDKPPIGDYLVFEYDGLGDKFLVILFPDTWKYEFIEIWWPGSSWNFFGNSIAIGGDYELHWGRTEYASIGGCYYATRLAVTEYLSKIGRQAGVLVIREAYPEHYMPIGVWYVRESVRRALSQKPEKFSSFEEAIRYALSKLRVSPTEVIESSFIVKFKTQQKTLTEYFK